jgi:NADPH-dependent 2,4-dienoyl-CoA reductase/sulfur reductase-like enzyme/nitrite reductase/ring-hydroxylating ferredoxin subunit
MNDQQVPNFKTGFPLKNLVDGQPVAGKVDEDDVILVRRGSSVFAVGAFCTHYHGSLADGLVVDDTVRCPLHHACFSLRTGEALRAPAFDKIDCWRTDQLGGTVFVREKLTQPPTSPSGAGGNLKSIVIIGGGAAALAAAEMLRREGYDGRLVMISADDSAPYDRPNLSKDFLAGTAPADWIPLRAPDFYTALKIELLLNSRVAAIHAQDKAVLLENGTTYNYDSLLLATGADPVPLSLPGAAASRVHYLRSFDDSKTIADKASSARRVLVAGASFIGLEVAASLRGRNIEVHVVAPEQQPLEKVLGVEVGEFIRKLHESHGVVFHLGRAVDHVRNSEVVLNDGTIVDADFMVVGAGVRPSLALADQAGLTVDRGVVVNQYLETSHSGIYAAGDIARWPDPRSRQAIRVEHWVVAERQGQVAAKNMLGRGEPFNAVPFFWSQHYDVTVNYVGHAELWDEVHIDGSLEEHNCSIDYRLKGKTLAIATIARDLASLQAELAMERGSGITQRW